MNARFGADVDPTETRFVTGRYLTCAAVGEARLGRKRSAGKLDDAVAHSNSAIGGDFETEPTRTSGGLALVDDQPLRKRSTGHQQPPAEVRAGGPRPRILDHRPEPGKEKAGEHVVSLPREDVSHRPWLVLAEREQEIRLRCDPLHRIASSERDDQLVAAGVDPQGPVDEVATRDPEHRCQRLW